MTDPRPRPRYGEYADVPPVAPPPEPIAQPPVEAPVARARPAWDLVLTTVLLLWGVIDVVRGFPEFARLGTALAAAYESQGLPEFGSESLADDVGGWLNIVRLVLLIVAIAGALLLISRRKRAFWVPLSAGVLAALVVVIAVMAIVLTDPGFAEYVAQQTAR